MQAQTLASGPGWSVQDIRCHAGPNDRRFEEQHQAVCIAAVIGGSFQYRTTQGSATLVPGALLLGNHGQCFECGHDHATGDRCLSFQYHPDVFETIRAATPRGVGMFDTARLPPLAALSPILAAADHACHAGDAAALEEISLDLAATTLGLLGDAPPPAAPATRDERRITAVLRHIETESNQPLSLSGLARDAGMSRYHFLRVFRTVVGLTPHQFILHARMHAAAVALRRGDRPVLDIALDAGFADLSTFNRRFRRVMGATPGAWGKRGGNNNDNAGRYP